MTHAFPEGEKTNDLLIFSAFAASIKIEICRGTELLLRILQISNPGILESMRSRMIKLGFRCEPSAIGQRHRPQSRSRNLPCATSAREDRLHRVCPPRS